MEFLITMTAGQAAQAQEMLASIGVDFRPQRNLVTIDDPGLTGRGITGTGDAANVIMAVNNCLEKDGGTLVPQDPENLDLEEMGELLTFAHTQFHWESGKPLEAYFETVEGITCREAIRDGCPNLDKLLNQQQG